MHSLLKNETIMTPLIPTEGLPVLHLFYTINHAVWQSLDASEQAKAKTRLSALLEEASGWEKFKVIPLAMIARADLGFMILGADLQQVNLFEKRLAVVLGAEVLLPVYSYFSMTERSEYTPTVEVMLADLAKQGIAEGHPEFAAKKEAIESRHRYATHDRMYPTLPDWPFVCFYPMNKRRDPGANWYALSFEERSKLMAGHGRVGRKYAGKVQQLVTGSTGLDDWEWGVTLFAKDPLEIKAIVYEMRFDEVSHGYAEFGEFYTGLQMPLGEVSERVGL
jgi:chlorite dismutase